MSNDTNIKELYLARHGEIATGGVKRFIGGIDPPLNETGQKQAAMLGDSLSDVRFDAVFCSHLARSVSTARVVCQKQKVWPIVNSQLGEIHLGVWEGKSFDQIRSLYPAEFNRRGADIVNHRPPGGESFAQCAVRVVAALNDILNGPVGRVLIIGHAGVNRIIICHLLGVPLANLFKIRQDYGCLNIFVTDGFGPQLVTLNKCLDK
ncbi:MAG: alpha-ribazole phosphatase [Firmicutes bacterium]|nr:alpha-ribazole phosphatase [Bacillota bacterium]